MFFVVPLMFLLFVLPILAEEIVIEIPAPQPEYIELARIDTDFSKDIQVAYPLPIEAFILINPSEEEAYIERLQIHAEGDQWLVGESFWKFRIKPGARLEIPLVGPRKINEIHIEGKANIVIRGIVDDGSIVLLEKIRLRKDEEVFTIDGRDICSLHVFVYRIERKSIPPFDDLDNLALGKIKERIEIGHVKALVYFKWGVEAMAVLAPGHSAEHHSCPGALRTLSLEPFKNACPKCVAAQHSAGKKILQ